MRVCMNCHREHPIFNNGQSWIFRYERYYTSFKRRGFLPNHSQPSSHDLKQQWLPPSDFILLSVIAYVTLEQTWTEVPLRETPGGGADNRVGGSHSSESLLNQSDNIVLGVTTQLAVYCSEWNVKSKPWTTVATRQVVFLSRVKEFAPARPNLRYCTLPSC